MSKKTISQKICRDINIRLANAVVTVSKGRFPINTSELEYLINHHKLTFEKFYRDGELCFTIHSGFDLVDSFYFQLPFPKICENNEIKRYW